MNQVIHFYLNQTLPNGLDMFGFNLNFIDSNNDVRENDVQNSSISNLSWNNIFARFLQPMDAV